MLGSFGCRRLSDRGRGRGRGRERERERYLEMLKKAGARLTEAGQPGSRAAGQPGSRAARQPGSGWGEPSQDNQAPSGFGCRNASLFNFTPIHFSGPMSLSTDLTSAIWTRAPLVVRQPRTDETRFFPPCPKGGSDEGDPNKRLFFV